MLRLDMALDVFCRVLYPDGVGVFFIASKAGWLPGCLGHCCPITKLAEPEWRVDSDDPCDLCRRSSNQLGSTAITTCLGLEICGYMFGREPGWLLRLPPFL